MVGYLVPSSILLIWCPNKPTILFWGQIGVKFDFPSIQLQRKPHSNTKRKPRNLDKVPKLRGFCTSDYSIAIIILVAGAGFEPTTFGL